MNRIVLIGVGGIGFRHFQSLMTDRKHELHLTLVDVDKSALLKAEEYEAQNINNFIKVDYVEDIALVQGAIDVAIIATSSMVRRKIFEELTSRAEVKNVIFEKFLFPKMIDYQEVKQILDIKKIRAFVNCPCRLYPGYVSLKEELRNVNHLDVGCTGSNWGMACNVIHTIDVLGFLLDSYDTLMVDASMLDEEVIEAKRKGYIEFTGRLMCELGNKANIVFDSDKTGETPFKFTIYAGDKIYTILEEQRKMLISHKGECRECDFPIYYQSQLTATVIDELIETDHCGLTRFDDTIQWHTAFLSAFLEKYNQATGSREDACPIT